MKKEDESVDELATCLFNFYFEEKNENELYDKINGFTIEKESKDGLSLKKFYWDLFHAYITYLARRCYISKDRNKRFYEKVKELFRDGEAIPDPNLSSLASISYELIEYKNGVYVLSPKRDSALNKFRFDPEYREERRILPLIQIRKKN